MAETFRIVMRMKGLWPKDLGGFEGHRLRKGGDLGHVDSSRSGLNRRLIGDEDWARQVQAEVLDMAQENFADELESLKRRRRKAQMLARLTEGPKDPWRATRHGPMREIILTANRKWFGQEDEAESAHAGGPEPEVGTERMREFEGRAIAWLRKEFGEDVVHARADLDEAAYHIHAVILPRAIAQDGRRVLQPSKFAVIRDYEEGQDSVGEWFAELGLQRGERRAKRTRDALEHNSLLRNDQGKGARTAEDPVPIPKKRRHVSPRDWRRAQELKLAERDKTLVTQERKLARDKKAVQAIVQVVQAVAEGDISATEPRDKDTPSGNLARQIFGRAFARLKDQAKQDAEARVAKAHAEIVKADEVIVRIAQLLPAAARNQIAAARPMLSARITGLARWLRKTSPGRPEPGEDTP
ncbi:plasmid recombination protein [Salipiger sp. H15]|uniref:Plasmid recombination protein n=1 Tax=Alloyangia sp. H15 TaxID=3029062 RepID=A0AAU8AI19_9RHOB